MYHFPCRLSVYAIISCFIASGFCSCEYESESVVDVPCLNHKIFIRKNCQYYFVQQNMRQEVKYLLKCYMDEDLREGNIVSPPVAGFCQVPNMNIFSLGDAQPQILERVIGAGNGAPLNFQQRQRIRVLAGNLRCVADRLNNRRMPALSDAELQGLNRDEIRAVRNSFADGFRVSRAVENLSNCLTSRTMRVVLQFISRAGQTVTEDLAMACELTTSLVRRFWSQNRTFSSAVVEVIDDFIAERLDLG
ncbi:uncharacterized protein LOC118188087 isoform X2 [Stegodyphus dumicola]|uniref:uncharacterized protein LOC118188087 isoform X2 n=1 Tax=Stegodyphus dumicola TaxID=202533 RepID=UPI0015AD5CB8|nr:uncharacterized protein LOC118188087 isoform X2 [Stegodyphus dumicola]